MFLKNDKRFTRNFAFLKVIDIVFFSLLAAASVTFGILFLLVWEKPITGAVVLGAGVVLSILSLFVIWAVLDVVGSAVCDMKLIRNKLYGNENDALIKFIGYEGIQNADVTPLGDYISAIPAQVAEEEEAPEYEVPKAPAYEPAPQYAPAPQYVPQPMAAPAPQPAAPAPQPAPAPAPQPAVAPAPQPAAAPAPKAAAPKASAPKAAPKAAAPKAASPKAKPAPKAKAAPKPNAIDTTGVDPAALARLDALRAQGTISDEQYKLQIERLKKK